METFDDFDTQIQSDEVYLRMKAGEYFESELEDHDSDFQLDCCTSGELNSNYTK